VHPNECNHPGQECEGRHDVDRRGHAEPVRDESGEESRLAITVIYLAV
jgi:hypothetical protein